MTSKNGRRLMTAVAAALTLALVFTACADSETASTTGTDGTTATTGADGTTATTGSPSTTAPSGERILRIAVADDLPSIDPIRGQNTLTNMVLKNIYAQFLFYAPPEGEVGAFAFANTDERVGRSVERIEYSDGGSVVTMHIRKGTIFPETGNEMTADDFMFYYERAFCAKASTMFNSNSYGVTSLDQVERIDDYTIRVTLEAPSPIIENQLRAQVAVILDSGAIIPNITDADPCANEWITQNYAGHGAYRLAEWDRGTKVVFEANPAWAWDEPYFTTVEILVIPDASNRILLLERGEVDIAMDLDERQLADLSTSPDANVLTIPGRRTMRLMLNNTVPPFDNKTVRQALNYGVNYDTILEDILQGTGDHLPGSVSPNSNYFQELGFGDLEVYAFDPEKAKTLLTEAGFPDGFSFTLMIPQGNPLVDELATFLRSEFQNIGVTMEIERATSAILAEAMGQGTGDAYLRGWLNDFVDEPYFHFNLWWRTNSTINWTKYTNPRIDEIVAALQFETDKTVQGPLALEAMEIVIDDAPEVWLAGGATQVAIAPDLLGWIHEPDELPIWGSLYREE